MSENGECKPTRKEFEARLVKKAMMGDAFRRELLQDPKETLQKELDQTASVKLPAELEVKVVEQPPSPAEALTDGELDQVAGGGFDPKAELDEGFHPGD